MDATDDTRRILGADAAPPPKPSRLPHVLRFPIVIILSLGWSAVGYSLISQWTTSDDVAAFGRVMSQGEMMLLLAWRVSELCIGWYGNYDGYDLAALSTLAYGPTLFLFSAFYNVQPWTLAASLAVDIFSSVAPFALLRPLSPAHAAAPTVPNRELLQDGPIRTFTTLFATAIYAVVPALSYNAWLRRSLLLNFVGIPSIEPSTSLGANVFAGALLLLFGYSARVFVFDAAAATGTTPEDAVVEAFDPVSATLGETLWQNAWGFRTQTKVAIRQTLVIVLVSFIRTTSQCALTVQGVEAGGAAAYALVWAAASIVAGIAMGLVID
ncbi:hypothetical protein MAPG_06517 [Magnaporthiopsis poae ATCC 64411]|uniref:Uncharacterized protein n=1 Tax=Magnaporthiopsis poae (strain ATCC 64411 / 73-15) TaxID=644358 RepID=A0A0C4E288_MAGP6|nr:hypothetical protein MAPG_06517 [Magnaporthiopsis poae ATCC 64411]